MTVSWLPLHHDMGLFGFVLTPLVATVSATFLATELFIKRVGLWFDAIDSQRGTITFAPNFALALAHRRLKNCTPKSWDLSSVRILGCGAEPIDADVLENFSEMATVRYGMSSTAVMPSYGMAEATLAITFSALDTRFRVHTIDAAELSRSGNIVTADASTERVRRVVSCGGPLPMHEIAVRMEDGTRAPELCQGEVVLRGPSVAPGYFKNSRATGETFRTGWLHTGDLGYIADGELYLTGRRKDVMICAGVKHHAVDVERLASSVAGVPEGRVAAFSIPGPDTEEIVLVLECARAVGESLAEAVASHVRRELGAPLREVVRVSPGSLLRTTSGKLRRAAMREWYLESRTPQHQR
jgi:fatty-acyl-CoA synthase